MIYVYITLVPRAILLVKGNWDDNVLLELGAAGQDEVPPQLFKTIRLRQRRMQFLVSENAFKITDASTVDPCRAMKDCFLQHLKEQPRVRIPLVNWILDDI